MTDAEPTAEPAVVLIDASAEAQAFIGTMTRRVDAQSVRITSGRAHAGADLAGTTAREDPPAVFYTLPARHLVAGVSTDDGRDVLDVRHDSGFVLYDVYIPALDDPDRDEENRDNPEGRIDELDDLVELAVYGHTEVNLSGHPAAVITGDNP